MPVEYLILPELDITYVRYKGRVTTAQVFLAFDAYLSDDEFRPGRPEFADLSRVSEFDIVFSDIRAHFDRVIEFYKSGKSKTFTAIFAPDPDASNMAYAYAQMTNGVDILEATVFVHADDAVAALGLSASAQDVFDLVEKKVRLTIRN